MITVAKSAAERYGESASYSLLYKDLYPQDSQNLDAILQGLDSDSITRDTAITAITQASGLSRQEVENRYNFAMTAQALTAVLAGTYLPKGTSVTSKETVAKDPVSLAGQADNEAGILVDRNVIVGEAKAIDDSASYAKWWDDLAQPKNLSDREARAWYLSKEAEIPARINSSASLEEQAKQAFDMRNDLRSTARELMSNRTLADSLNKTDPNRTWNEIVNKYSGQGLSGDELWSKIIEKSQASRTSVNDGLGM
ncbi:hypothetical protein CCL13_16260 [Pseudomonas syringae]|nr:hypothetical protein [Pseudomonas syringae]PBP44777.1 hypothetical protein CCL13_16260 [Pseudomonas syringae]